MASPLQRNKTFARVHHQNHHKFMPAGTIYRNAIFLLLFIMPLICYDGMKWSFHAPRYLLLQFGVFFLLGLHFFKAKTSLRISWLDLSITTWIVLIVIQALLLHGGGDLFNRIDILLYFGLFYFSIQLLELKQQQSRTKGILHYSFLILAITALLLSIYGILQFFSIDPLRSALYPSAESRVIATMGNANSLGGYLAAVFPFFIYHIRFAAKKGGKALWIVSSLIVLIALVLTLSRGAWLGLIGGFVILLFYKTRSIWQGKLWKLILVTAITIFISVFSWISYKINSDSALGRLFIWKISAQMIADHPAFGIGYGRYGVEYLNYQAKFFDQPEHAKFYDWADNLKGAKNEYIQIIAETGIIGGAITLFVLIVIYAICLKMMKITAGNKKDNWQILVVMISMSVILFHGLVDNPLYDVSTALILWFDVGIISLLAKEKRMSLLTNCGRWRSIEFRHHFILRLVGVGFLLYNSFQVFQKGQGYIDWQHGQDLVASGHWERGIAEYEQARTAFPNDGELKFHLGSAYTYIIQPEKGLPLIHASQQKFNDKNLYIVQGYALIQLNRFAEAETSFRKALRMYPKLLLPRLWLAELYHQQGRAREALSELHRILDITPKINTDEVKRIKLDARRKLSVLEGNDNLR